MGRFFKYRRNDVSNCCNQVKCHWLSKAEVSPRTLTIAKLNKAGTSHIAALTGFAGAGGADARAQSSEGVKRARTSHDAARWLRSALTGVMVIKKPPYLRSVFLKFCAVLLDEPWFLSEPHGNQHGYTASDGTTSAAPFV